MLQKIQSAFDAHDLIAHGQRIIVAVSGGADSIGLLHALKEIASSLRLKLIVAHLNHGIRGHAANEDAAFVEARAKELRLKCVVGRRDVPRMAKQKGISLEMAARDARYVFFAKVLRQEKADVVAIAHTLDDQAETILLKLARGAGTRGLSGIRWRKVLGGLIVIRPMLEVSRQEVIAYLKERNLTWREDESNSDVAFLRNRVRHEILPQLASKLNPNIKNALVRTARILGDEDAWLDAIVDNMLPDCVESAKLSVERILSHPIAARRRILRSWAVDTGVPPEYMSFDIVEKIDRMLHQKRGRSSIDVGGGWQICRAYGDLVSRRGNEGCVVDPYRTKLNLPGETLLPDQCLRVTIEIGPGLTRDKTVQAGLLPAAASLSALSIGRKNIYIRSWCAGDRMKPLGMGGTKKLQDIFVDEKVLLAKRQAVPILECGKSIIWIPGYRVAKGWEVTDQDADAVHVRVDRLS